MFHTQFFSETLLVIVLEFFREALAELALLLEIDFASNRFANAFGHAPSDRLCNLPRNLLCNALLNSLVNCLSYTSRNLFPDTFADTLRNLPMGA